MSKRRPGESAGIDWDKQPLGEVSDAEVAAGLSCNRSTVQRQRAKRGIPAKGRFCRNLEHIPLGEVPDSKIAEMLGISLGGVSRLRSTRGIPCFGFEETKTCPCGEKFTSVRVDHTYHSRRCGDFVRKQRRNKGIPEETLPVALALSELRREITRHRRRDGS